MSNEFLAKMIGVVVAFVVLAVVLVPICNSLTEGDGGNGGGSGDGGVGDVTGTYQYGTMTIQTLDEFASFLENSPELKTEYNEDETEVLVISEGEVIATLPTSDTEGDIALLPLMYYHADLTISPEVASTAGIEKMYQESWMYLTYGNRSEIVTVSKGMGEYEGNVVNEQVYGNTGTDPNGYNVFENVEASDMISMLESVEMEIIYLQKNGEYVYAEGLDFNNVSSKIIVMGYNKDVREESPADWDNWDVVVGYTGMISGLTSDTVTYATAHNASGMIRPTEPLEITSTNPISISVEFEDDHVSTFTIDSAIIPIGESGGGSSSDNGDLGTAGTIIKIIPIFVALGLIMSIVGLFYQNRKAI